MSDEKSSLKFSQGYELLIPKDEKAYPVPISDWNYLKKKIDRIKSAVPVFHTIGSVLLGIAGSAFFAALTLPRTITQVGTPTVLVCWAIFGVVLISGLLSLYFTHQQRKTIIGSRDDVLEAMNHLQEKYATEPVNNELKQPGELLTGAESGG